MASGTYGNRLEAWFDPGLPGRELPNPHIAITGAEVIGSTNTKLYFSQPDPDQVREVQRMLVGKTSGPEADQVGATIRGLPKLTCLVSSAHFKPYRRVSVVPYRR